MKGLKLWALSCLCCLGLWSVAAAGESNVALTSVGQSPDAMMVRVVLKSLKVKAEYNALMKASELGDAKVLVAVVGGSSKGLGAAGIDKDGEVARAKELLEAARTSGVKVLVMHVGGEGRRGTLSDLFIKSAVPFAESLIVVDGANDDELFTGLVAEQGIEVLTAPNVKSTKAPLEKVLTAWGAM